MLVGKTVYVKVLTPNVPSGEDAAATVVEVRSSKFLARVEANGTSMWLSYDQRDQAWHTSPKTPSPPSPNPSFNPTPPSPQSRSPAPPDPEEHTRHVKSEE